MKSISNALTNFLLDNTLMNRADLITIVLPNSQVMNVLFGTNYTSITYPVLPVTITVSGTTYPWLPTDPTYPYTPSGGTASATIALNQGQIVMLQYASGFVTLSEGYPTDANGGAGALGRAIISTDMGATYPGVYISPIVAPPAALIGGFANAAGWLVSPPFFIGDNAVIGPAPAGTTQLLLGNTSNDYATNGGSWTMTIVPTTYYCTLYGSWERGPFSNKADFKLSAESMKLTALVPETVIYPGTAVDIIGGELTRLDSASLAGVYGPDLLFNYNPAGAYGVPGFDTLRSPTGEALPARAAITAIYAVVSAAAISGETSDGPFNPEWGCSASLDGGVSYIYDLFGNTGPTITPNIGTQNFTVNITSGIGTISSFDFTKITFRVTQADALLNEGTSPAILTVDPLGLLFVYNISPGTYLMTCNNGTEIPAWTGGTGWPPETPDGSAYGTAFVLIGTGQGGGGTALMQSLIFGTLAGSQVIIQTLFWPLGSPPSSGFSMGTMQLQQGQIGNIKNTGRSIIECEVFDLTYILNRPFPPHLIQSSCRHNFCDAGCTLLISNYTSTAITVESGSNLYLDFGISTWASGTAYSYGNLIIYSSTIFMCVQAGTSGGSFVPSVTEQLLGGGTFTDDGGVGWNSMGSYVAGTAPASASGEATQAYPGGYVIGIAGQNKGFKMTVKAQTTATSGGYPELQLLKPLPFPVTAGDTFKLVMGCDKTLPTCENIYNNLLHIGAMPFVPAPEVAMFIFALGLSILALVRHFV